MISAIVRRQSLGAEMGFATGVLEDFLSNSSLHGLRFLGKKLTYHWTERLFWLICCTLSWVGSIFLILSSYEAFQNNPMSYVVSTAYFGNGKDIFDKMEMMNEIAYTLKRVPMSIPYLQKICKGKKKKHAPPVNCSGIDIVSAARMVYIHEHSDVPNANPVETAMMKVETHPGEHHEIYLTFQETENAPGVEDIDYEKRKCKFHWENEDSEFYRFYSYSTCVVECRLRAEMALFSSGTKSLVQLKLHRLPTEKFSRTVVRSKLDLAGKSIIAMQLTILFLASLTKPEKCFPVSMGSAAGLFVGASLLSFVEILCCLTLRLCFKKQSPESRNKVLARLRKRRGHISPAKAHIQYSKKQMDVTLRKPCPVKE
ncbi:hypothetical protein C0J52_03023 [Blattella germanica]|nr:hypothetical protein C0J52_03023 [Blattella germanica]